MGELIGFELKKIFISRRVKLCIALVIVLSLVGVAANVLGETRYFRSEESWVEAIARIRDTHHSNAGFLTEEKLFTAGSSIARAYDPENMQTYSDGGREYTSPTNEAYRQYVTSQGGIADLLRSTFRYAHGDSYFDLSSISGEKAAAYYEVRAGYVDYYLDLLYPVSMGIGQNEQIHTFAYSLEEKVNKPFYHDYYRGWQAITSQSLGTTIFLTAFLCCMCITPVFAGEYGNSMDSILLTCKYGRSKLSQAKIIAALLFSLGLYLVFTFAYLGGNLLVFGFNGWNSPIQFTMPPSVVPLNYLQLFLLGWLIGGLGYFAIIGIALVFSAFVRNVVLALPLALAFMAISPLLPSSLAVETLQLSYFLPTSALYATSELFKVNMVFFLGIGVWVPIVMAVAAFLIIFVSLPVAASRFNKHQVR